MYWTVSLLPCFFVFFNFGVHVIFIAGHANIYFRLASQFLTQDEPAYCGVSTLGCYLFIFLYVVMNTSRIYKFTPENSMNASLQLRII